MGKSVIRTTSWIALLTLGFTVGVHAQQNTMTFFITSVGPGKGADLGGIEGADRHCQSLAEAAGAGARTWRAYLSTQAAALNDPKFVNAPRPNWRRALAERQRRRDCQER